jgi:hypothetical protein
MIETNNDRKLLTGPCLTLTGAKHCFVRLIIDTAAHRRQAAPLLKLVTEQRLIRGFRALRVGTARTIVVQRAGIQLPTPTAPQRPLDVIRHLAARVWMHENVELTAIRHNPYHLVCSTTSIIIIFYKSCFIIN